MHEGSATRIVLGSQGNFLYNNDPERLMPRADGEYSQYGSAIFFNDQAVVVSHQADFPIN